MLSGLTHMQLLWHGVDSNMRNIFRVSHIMQLILLAFRNNSKQ